MTVQSEIQTKLASAFTPLHLEVVNESHGHNVPPNSETHFKVVVVSNGFDGLTRVARHQKVYGLLANELANGVHALAVHTYTPDEWSLKDGAPASPLCSGGSKH